MEEMKKGEKSGKTKRGKKERKKKKKRKRNGGLGRPREKGREGGGVLAPEILSRVQIFMESYV